MKAAVVQADGSLKLEDVPTPAAAPGSVVVKVAYCGICGSDLHMLEAGYLPSGCIIGHEMSGTVAEVGAGVQGWSERDPVAVLPISPCFACEPCRRGSVTICNEVVTRSYGLGARPGGFSPYMCVEPATLFRLPAAMKLRDAALNEPWAVAVHAVNLSGIKMGQCAAVIGTGPIGLFTVYALKAAGAVGIFASEPDHSRAERARAAGADLLADPSRQSLASQIQERAGRQPSHVFDCAGTGASFQEAAELADHHGVIMAVGVPMKEAALFPLTWFLKELRLAFSLGYTYEEFGTALELLARGAADAEVVTSAVMPLADISEAVSQLRCASGHAKILIDCQA